MKLLLLGGSGFVSGRVLRFSLEAGHEVIAVTRGTTPLPPHAGFLHIQADRNDDNLSWIANEHDIDAVLDVICQTPAHAVQAVDLARNCKRLVMVSSDYAYDPRHRPLNMAETVAQFSDFDDYGGRKRQAEQVLLDGFAEGRTLPTILRPPHIYGPGSNPGTIPQHGRRPHLLDDIKAGKTLNLLHGGLGLIQPIHADDFARLILAVVEKDASHGEDYTAAGPDLMSHLDYYIAIARCLNTEISVTAYCPEPGAQDVNNYVAGHRYYDTEKLRALLPDFTYTPFEVGIQAWVEDILRRPTNS
jgi:nucleoside-diphosphate-sugar epimerase